MKNLILNLYRYSKFLGDISHYNTKKSIFFSQFLDDYFKLGVKTFPLMACLSIAVGFVSALQLVVMLKNIFVPENLIPVGLKNITLLEFSPTIMCFIYVGRNITSISCQLYDMRKSGYFDNLKVIGINIESFACLSKVYASSLCYPLLAIFSAVFSIIGGHLYCVEIGQMSSEVFWTSCVSVFNREYIVFFLIKSFVFGFLCGSVSSFLGFCFYKNDNVDLNTVNQTCFTICCTVILLADIVLGSIRALILRVV